MILNVKPINPDPVLVGFVAGRLFQVNRSKLFVCQIDTKIEQRRPEG
jgi:hypothetical protein